MRLSRWKVSLFALSIALIPLLVLTRARGSDHADTPAIAAAPGTDLTDVFVFPSPTNSSNVVLVMNVHPLIPTGQGLSVSLIPPFSISSRLITSATSRSIWLFRPRLREPARTSRCISPGLPRRNWSERPQLR